MSGEVIRAEIEAQTPEIVRGRALAAFSYSAFGGEFPPGVAERAAHSVDQRILGLSGPATD